MAQFTKKAIIDSFMKLLEQKPLDKITVKDIIEDCDINRGTFYYYFSDIYMLVESIFEEETSRIVDEYKSYQSWREGFLEAMQLAIKNKRQLYHAYNSLNHEKMERYLYNIASHLIWKFVCQQAESLTVSDEDKKFITQVYACALVGLTILWISEGMKDNPKIFIDKMGTLLEGNIRKDLEKSIQFNSNK